MMLTLRAFFMFVAVTVIVTYPLVFHLEEFVTNPIDPLLYVWNLDHNFLAMTGQRSFLDTNMFYPTSNTIAYSDHLFGESIVLFPLFFFIKNPLVIQNLYILSTFVLSALGVYLLVYHFSKRFWPSCIAGILYSFSLYHIDHLGQVPTTSIQWIPFTFLYLYKSVQTKKLRDIILFWIFFSLNFLSTLYYGLFVMIPIGLFFIFYRKSWSEVKRILVYGIPFAFILIAASYPYIVFRLENPDVVRSIEESVLRSARMSDYINPRLLHDRALFPGFVTLALSALALFFIRKNREVLFFGIVAITTIILSLGPLHGSIPLPYMLLYKFIPLFQAIRVPSRFGIIAVFAFCILAGFGMNYLLDKLKSASKKVLIITAVLFLIFIELFQQTISFATVPTLENAPPVYSWLKDQKNSIVLELPLRHGYNSNPIEEQVYKSYDHITEYDNYVAETFRLYFATIHRQKMANGYSSYFPTTYQNLATAMETFPSPFSIGLIKEYKISHILIHKNQYGPRWKDLEIQIANTEEFKIVQNYENEILYEIIETL